MCQIVHYIGKGDSHRCGSVKYADSPAPEAAIGLCWTGCSACFPAVLRCVMLGLVSKSYTFLIGHMPLMLTECDYANIHSFGP